jgi:4-diphosphocytidyl-2C-methyl-D-erythritol kinase
MRRGRSAAPAADDDDAATAARHRLSVLAAAKLNLHLRVGPVQPDGFHPLLTWMVTIGLFDRLTFEHRRLDDDKAGSEANDAGCIEFSCDDPTLPTDERNLVVRAARSLGAAARALGCKRSGGATRIHLEKRVPHAAGLGGGSADASRTLEALRELWSLQALSRSAVSSLAAELGSDVPFFLHAPSSICRGRGEIVEPTPAPAVARWAVLILPAIALSTAAVYGEFDRGGFATEAEATGATDATRATDATELDARGLGKARAGEFAAGLSSGAEAGEPAWQEWARLSAASLLPRLVNDLERPAFELSPELARLRADCEQQLGRIVRMSGSGSTLFTLFDAESEARAAADQMGRIVRAVAVELAPKIEDDLGGDSGRNCPGQGNTSVERGS